jgi:hypothetical protein
MKKIVLAVFIGLLSASTSFAVPLLQLYIEGATYDSTETWVSSQNPFTLWVMGNVNGDGGKGTISSVFLSAAYLTSETGTITITPTMTSLVPDPSTPAAPTIPLSDSHGDGTQPLTGDGSALPKHGIFGTGVSWDKFLIGNFSLTDSPTADLITSFPSYPSGASSGQINAYTVVITGFSWVHFDAFDHYIKSNNDLQYVQAPFSHDAEDTGGGQEIPEPTTLLLLGSGLVGSLPFLRRKFKRS